MALSYPAGCDTPRRKIEYLFRATELIRLLQNKMVFWKNNDITEHQYHNFLDNFEEPLIAEKMKIRYPYAVRLTQVKYDDFWEKVYRNLEDKIHQQLGVQKNALRQLTTWPQDLGVIWDNGSTDEPT